MSGHATREHLMTGSLHCTQQGLRGTKEKPTDLSDQAKSVRYDELRMKFLDGIAKP